MLPIIVRESLVNIRQYIREGEADESDYSFLGNALEDLADHAFDPLGEYEDELLDEDDYTGDDKDLAEASTDEYRKED